MKQIIVILLSFLSSYSASAQDIEYDTCSALAQHQGEWRYTNGNDTIRIFLKYHRSYSSMATGFVTDDLWGNLEYKHGNNIVFSDYANRNLSLPFIVDSLPLDRRTLFLRYDISDPTHHILHGILLYEFNGTQEYYVDAVLNPAGTQLTWKQRFSHTLRELSDIYIPSNQPTGLNRMPSQFVLIKQ